MSTHFSETLDCQETLELLFTLLNLDDPNQALFQHTASQIIGVLTGIFDELAGFIEVFVLDFTEVDAALRSDGEHIVVADYQVYSPMLECDFPGVPDSKRNRNCF